MTKLRPHPKPRWRETAVTVRDPRPRILAVSLAPTALLLRQKGRRHKFELPYAVIYQLAAKAEADAKVAGRRRRRAVARGCV